jgi:hypothetical protein
MLTKAQALRVVGFPGGEIVLDEQGSGTAKVRLKDFEAVRPLVESEASFFAWQAIRATPCQVCGWTVQGAKFEVAWPKDRERYSLICSHFGGRRFADNWGPSGGQGRPPSTRRGPNTSVFLLDPSSATESLQGRQGRGRPLVAGELEGVLGLGDGRPRYVRQELSPSQSGVRGRAGEWASPGHKKEGCSKNRVRFTTGAMRLEEDGRGNHRS